MSLAFEREHLERHLSEAAADVLGTMFFAGVEEDVGGAVEVRGEPRMAASLEFHGACSGKLGLSLDRAAAGSLAASFFGDQGDSEPEQDCRSVMAELTNMVCGAMLSRLDRQSIFCLGSPEAMPPGGEPDGEIVRTLRLEEGLLRLAFSIEDGGKLVDAA